MLQQDEPDDYVLATGQSYSVREFVERAFAEIGRELTWEGSGAEEVGRSASSGEILVAVDPRYYRPTEVESLLGDASKAQQRLGWKHTTEFPELVAEMVAADLKALRQEEERKNRHE